MENFCADALFKDENWGKRQPWHHFGTISSAFLSPIPRPHAVLCNLPRVHACWTLIFCLRSDVVLIQASGTSSPPTRWGPHSGSTHSSDPPTRATHRTTHRVPHCTTHRATRYHPPYHSTTQAIAPDPLTRATHGACVSLTPTTLHPPNHPPCHPPHHHQDHRTRFRSRSAGPRRSSRCSMPSVTARALPWSAWCP